MDKCPSEWRDRLKVDYGLTDRQLEVVSYVIRGMSNADTAKELGISYDGVAQHLWVVYRKMGILGGNKRMKLIMECM